MGSPLGPLMANTFMCSLEEQLKLRDKLPSYYRRYVDDTLTVMKDQVSAYSFLHVLKDLHPSISFTMELPTENTLPFLGMVLRKDSQNITTSVYVKPTNTGLLLHYNKHVKTAPSPSKFVPRNLSLVEMLKLGKVITQSTTSVDLYSFDFTTDVVVQNAICY